MNKKLYVGNLPFTTTDTELKSMFEAYGAVDRVSIITDRETGRPRGFAFVEMGDSSSADSAIKGLDGREVGGRALRVNEATLHGRRRRRRRWWRRSRPLLDPASLGPVRRVRAGAGPFRFLRAPLSAARPPR